jgi:hypothetical protein
MGFFDQLPWSKRAHPRESDARSEGTLEPPGDESGKKPSPSPQRVLARARVLAAMLGRATLEREVAQGEYTAQENERIRRNVLRWLKKSGLNSELERGVQVPGHLSRSGARTECDRCGVAL